MSNFAKAFKTQREIKGLTQEEAAKLLGVSRSTIGMYETGKREPDYDMLLSISEKFEVPISVLIGFYDTEIQISKAYNKDFFNAIRSAYCTNDEHPLMSQFNQLNEEGQEKLLEYANDLVASGRYKKHNISEVVEGA